MEKNYDSWTFQDFLTYLLIYAAYADHIFNDKERDYIKRKVEAEEYNKIITIFHAHSEEERLKFVKLLWGKHATDLATQSEMRKEMVKLFFADEEYSMLERDFFSDLKRKLNLD